MKTTIKVLVVLALALATFTQHSTASAGSKLRFSGDTARASFTSVDPSGCITTDVLVFANDTLSQSPPGNGDRNSGVTLFISQVDTCNFILLMDAFGFAFIAPADFQVSSQLNSATLNATINVEDFVSGNTFDVFVNLTWTGSGPLSRDSSKFHSQTPHCQFHSSFKGSSRFAEASGTVSDGTVNFTPDPSWDGGLISAKGGQMTIGCT